MVIQLQPSTQNMIDKVLYGKDNAERIDSIKEIITLPDKDQVEAYLIDRLDSENDRWRITWSLSTLAEIGLPDGINTVLEHTTSPPEPDPWVRHFALIYAANFSPFPIAKIEHATKDPDCLPRATALRLLLANGDDQYFDDLLDMLTDSITTDNRWAASRALRNRSEVKMKPLRNHIEKQYIEPLVQITGDAYIPLDTRWEAIQALSTFSHQRNEIAIHLGDLLIKDKDPISRRYYLDALIKLDQPDDSLQALLHAIEDSDAQIRIDAATALETMLGSERSIQLLMSRALEREEDYSLIVDALRHIDSDLSAKALREAMTHPDAQIGMRANLLLTELGGQTAAQILMSERTKALDKYTDILSDADKDVRDHFKELMSQAKFAFWLSLIMHIIVFTIGIWALIASLSTALSQGLSTLEGWIGVGGAGASALIVLLTAFYRNPLINVRTSLNALMQVDVIFLGYIRQINQIDATFKHIFLDNIDFGTARMKDTVEEIQVTVKEALEDIQKFIYGK